jgi:DNA-binding SARP family transcriptional activator
LSFPVKYSVARVTRGERSIELLLLGQPELRLGGSKTELPSKKLLALVAYLALEGQATRAELADLLWDVGEERARANLRGELYRLRDTKLAVLLEETNGHLRLAKTVQSDLFQFKVFLGRKAWQEALGLQRGILLEGLELPDAPRFEEWLLLIQERWQEKSNEVLALHASHLVAQQQWSESREVFEQLLVADPWREEAVRGIIRSFAQTDEIPKALERFERFRVTIRNALGVEPAPETLELVAALRSPRMATVPPNFLRSAFVGRENEWAQLETAWAAKKFIFMYGQAGVGKTRLALEFAAKKGALTLIECGPIDSIAPYALFTRRISEALARVPLERLPNWIRVELARLVPEFAPEEISFSPEIPLEGKMRLFEATTQFLLQAIQGSSGLILDNAQYFDTSSFELGGYLSTRARQGQNPVCSILTFRNNEVPPKIQARVDEYIKNNEAVLIELKPLPLQAVQQMLEHHPKKNLDAKTLLQATGGNPLFVLELIRAWTGDGTLPITPAIGELLHDRLGKLSKSARDVARVAAISGAGFSLLIAARVLNTDALDLSESYEQLEQQGILSKGRFVHDLLLEAVLNATPSATQILLQTRLLEVLETMPLERGQAAERLRLAQAIGDGHKILFWAEQAAFDALDLFAFEKAQNYFQIALEALTRLQPNEALVRLQPNEALVRLQPNEALVRLQPNEALVRLQPNADLKTKLELGLEQAKNRS